MLCVILLGFLAGICAVSVKAALHIAKKSVSEKGRGHAVIYISIYRNDTFEKSLLGKMWNVYLQF